MIKWTVAKAFNILEYFEIKLLINRFFELEVCKNAFETLKKR